VRFSQSDTEAPGRRSRGRALCLVRPNTPERAFGYRVIAPGFVIEMGSVDPAAQHLHTVYHDLGNVLGRVSA